MSWETKLTENARQLIFGTSTSKILRMERMQMNLFRFIFLFLLIFVLDQQAGAQIILLGENQKW